MLSPYVSRINYALYVLYIFFRVVLCPEVALKKKCGPMFGVLCLVSSFQGSLKFSSGVASADISLPKPGRRSWGCFPDPLQDPKNGAP